MPEAARVRLATPPAGAALAPEPRCAFAAGPFTSENHKRLCTISVTNVNRKGTLISTRARAALVHKSHRLRAVHVAGFTPIDMKTGMFDERADWAVEVTTAADTLP